LPCLSPRWGYEPRTYFIYATKNLPHPTLATTYKRPILQVRAARLRVNQTVGGRIIQPGARTTGFAGILANAASRCTESSLFRSATLTCASRCAPSSVHRICCFFAMRWLTTCLNRRLGNAAADREPPCGSGRRSSRASRHYSEVGGQSPFLARLPSSTIEISSHPWVAAGLHLR
jgi:hypothetical protein